MPKKPYLLKAIAASYIVWKRFRKPIIVLIVAICLAGIGAIATYLSPRPDWAGYILLFLPWLALVSYLVVFFIDFELFGEQFAGLIGYIKNKLQEFREEISEEEKKIIEQKEKQQISEAGTLALTEDDEGALSLAEKEKQKIAS